jgi:hypothetical protein
MKKLLLLFLFTFFSVAIYSQSSTKILLAGVMRMNISKLKIRDPTSARNSFQPTGSAYTPGFGIAIQPYHGKILHLFFQLAYEERGSSEAYYFAISNTGDFLHIYDRFRCVYADILARAQNQKGFYFGLGGSICKPVNGYYRNHSSSAVLPARAHVQETTEISSLTYGISMAAGKNFSGKAEAELTSTWDVSPIISRPDATIFVWAASLTIRYYFLRPDE